ncbi:hypothetical protein A2U01_0053888, partial [Trifolium medium]|nr:hypothetical protein [Trifolium medium]
PTLVLHFALKVSKLRILCFESFATGYSALRALATGYSALRAFDKSILIKEEMLFQEILLGMEL